VRACAAARVGIVPRSGGTGLVGGQVLPDGPLPLVLSLDRMAALRGLWRDEGVMVAEAGMTLAAARQAAAAAGRMFPLSLASEGSARVGGVLATNAGGVNVLRWGSARDLCLGVEAVLADGSVLRGTTRLRKDNTGYDLRHLIIGSEGTLGIITAATLRLVVPPPAVAVALVAVPGPAAALDLLSLAQAETGGMVSAFELMQRAALDFLAETMPEIRQPFAEPPAWFVLVELGMADEASAAAALLRVFERAAERGLASDGVLAAGAAQRAAFWALRESIPEANRRVGAVASHDVSVPLSSVATFVARADDALARIGAFRINCFGHVGDGNLHYNVFPPPGVPRAALDGLRDAVSAAVHDIVHDLGGSVSAEHGIGRLRIRDLCRYGDPARLAAMRAVKAALDPKGILNPGAVLGS
jgi:FAD/FMN-containing dehydrogenase